MSNSQRRLRSGSTIHIDHVGVLVRDLETATAFFSNHLGLPVVHRQKIPSTAVDVAYLGTSGSMLQLLQPEVGSPLWKQLEMRGEGLHHICVATDSIGAIIGKLPGEHPAIQLGGRGMRTCFLEQSRFGVVIELAEPDASAQSGLDAARQTG
ncbi:MAG TPA: VOC family protein [Blastocatellia bacterium]|jgi:methylmalonyl-CoA/ethylmalonyl-CoA epimerase|nr:VOC family protein [Blastocatellia bacterium]